MHLLVYAPIFCYARRFDVEAWGVQSLYVHLAVRWLLPKFLRMRPLRSVMVWEVVVVIKSATVSCIVWDEMGSNPCPPNQGLIPTHTSVCGGGQDMRRVIWTWGSVSTLTMYVPDCVGCWCRCLDSVSCYDFTCSRIGRSVFGPKNVLRSDRVPLSTRLPGSES